jgi:hypothetical protein
MKFSTLQFSSIGSCYFIIMAISLIGLSSCSKKISFLSSSIVPAARGTVKVSTDNNQNNVIEVKITNLAEPERLQPPKQLYMVWMLTEENFTENLGQIETADGTFSKTLKASFKTVSTFKPIKVFITAENDPNVKVPDRTIILSTDQFRK